MLKAFIQTLGRSSADELFIVAAFDFEQQDGYKDCCW